MLDTSLTGLVRTEIVQSARKLTKEVEDEHIT
jgi:hypothetical protein